MRSRPVVTTVARTRNEGGHGTMVPESVIATMVAMATPPMVVATLSAHFVQYPVEDSRCNPIDNHVAEIQVTCGACRREDAVHPRTPVARREQALPVQRVLPVSILSSSRLPLLCECRRCTEAGNHAISMSAAGTIQCSEMSHPGHWFHDRPLPCIAAGSRCRTCSSLGAACNSLMSSSAPFRNAMLLNGTALRFVAGNAPAGRPGVLHCVP